MVELFQQTLQNESWSPAIHKFARFLCSSTSFIVYKSCKDSNLEIYVRPMGMWFWSSAFGHITSATGLPRHLRDIFLTTITSFIRIPPKRYDSSHKFDMPVRQGSFLSS